MNKRRKKKKKGQWFVWVLDEKAYSILYVWSVNKGKKTVHNMFAIIPS